MIPTLALTFLSLAPLVPAAPAEDAALHPATSELFGEIPDVGRLISAYRQAPLVRLANDAEVQRFLGSLAAGRKALGEIDQVLGNETVQAFLQGTRALSWSLGAGADRASSSFEIVAEFGKPELAKALESLACGGLGVDVPKDDAVAVFDLPEGPFSSGWMRTDGARLVVGGGGTTPESYASRAKGETPGWNTSPLVALGRKEVSHDQGAVVMRVETTRSPFLILADFAGFADRLPDSLAKQPALQMPRVLEMRLEGSRFVSDAFFPPSSISPSELPWLGRAIDPHWVDPIPADAMAFAVTSWNPQKMLALVPKLFGALGEQDVRLPDSLEHVLTHLGAGLTVYSFPIAGIGMPPVYIWCDLDDVDAFHADAEAFGAELPQLLRGASFETRDYRPKNAATGERERIPVTTIDLPEGMLQLGPTIRVSPSFAVVGKRLLLGFSGYSVKHELKRLFEESGTPGPLAARGVALAADTRMVLSMDWGAFLESVFGLVKGVGSLIGGMSDLPFDPQKLPDPKLFTRFLEPTLETLRLGEDGWHAHHEGSFGPEVGVGVAAFLLGRSASAKETDLEETPVDPNVPAVLTTARLSDLRTGLAVYQIAKGSYPESLAELTTPTADYPHGFLDAQGVPDDGWGHAFHYARLEDGASYELRSLGPDGIDQEGSGDDVVSDD